jgi:hypothetical protein
VLGGQLFRAQRERVDLNRLRGSNTSLRIGDCASCDAGKAATLAANNLPIQAPGDWARWLRVISGTWVGPHSNTTEDRARLRNQVGTSSFTWAKGVHGAPSERTSCRSMSRL